MLYRKVFKVQQPILSVRMCLWCFVRFATKSYKTYDKEKTTREFVAHFYWSVRTVLRFSTAISKKDLLWVFCVIKPLSSLENYTNSLTNLKYLLFQLKSYLQKVNLLCISDVVKPGRQDSEQKECLWKKNTIITLMAWLCTIVKK